VAAFEPLQQTAAAGAGIVYILRFFFHGVRTLAAQLLHARTDRGKIIGSTGSGHVSSLNIWPNRDGLRRFMDW